MNRDIAATAAVGADRAGRTAEADAPATGSPPAPRGPAAGAGPQPDPRPGADPAAAPDLAPRPDPAPAPDPAPRPDPAPAPANEPPSPGPDEDSPPVVTIDARALLCPLPVLRLRKALLAQPAGALVALEATDPAAVLDVPHFCAEGGHALVGATALPDGARRYLVRRGG